MPDSILDIVQRLSFEVNAKGLTDISNALTKQVQITNNLLDLNKKYSDQLKNTNDPAKIQQFTTSLNANNKALEAQGNAIKTIINNNPKLKEVYNQEITVIQTLSQKLTELKRQRDLATNPAAYANITAQIKKAQADINGTAAGAVGGGAGGGENSQLLGILGLNNSGQTIGRQLLTGSLLGLGFGGGLGLITRLTSGFVELVEKGVDAYINADEKAIERTEKLVTETENLSKALSELGNNIIKASEQAGKSDLFNLGNAANIDENALLEQTTEGIKRKAEAQKALGVVNGQVFGAAIRDLKADQDIREADLKVLKDQTQSLEQANQFIKQNALEKFDPTTTYNSGAAKTELALIQKSLDDNKNISGAAKVAIQKSILEARKADVDFYKAFNTASEQIQAEITDSTQKSTDKEKEIEDARVKFTSDHIEQIFQLNRTLNQKLIDENYAYNQAILANDVESEDRIKQQVEITREQQIEDVQREIQLAKDKGEYVASIADKYNKQVAQINDNARREEIEKLEIYYEKQAQASDSVNKSFEQAALQRASGKKQRGVTDENFTLQDFLDEADQINFAAAAAFAEGQEKIRQEAVIAGSDMTQVDAELAKQQEAVTEKSNDNKLKAWMEYYASLIILIETQSKRAANEILLATDTEIEKLSERLSRGLSLQRFGVLSQRVNLQGEIDTSRFDIIGNNKKISATQTELKNPNLSQADVARLNDELTSLKDQLKRLETTINKDEAELAASQRKDIADRIGLLQDLVAATQQAYDSIAEAQQKSLDREISVRTQRVDAAQKLAERGNIQALADEQKKLDAAEKQRRDAALREEAINAALVVSNALLAVAKAAAEGGGFGSIATIAAVIAALGIGFAEAEKLSAESKSSFATGVVGYRGRGTGTSDENPVWISNGESVITASGTRKHAPLLKAINAGEMLPTFTAIPAHYTHVSTNTSNGVNKSDFEALGARVDKVAEAVGNIHFVAKQDINHRGVRQMVETSAREQKSNWK